MKANIFIFFMGSAGSGKSTLVNAFQSWMFRQGYDAVTVNLDPGGIILPYNPDVDIRDWVRLEDVMDNYNLGPNGAQVTSSDLMYLHTEDIRESLDGFRTDYFLVDTPGQMELFTYREPTRDLIRSISLGGSIGVFLFEPLLSGTPEGMVSQLSMASTVKYRLDMPFIQVLNKVDLLSEEDRERIMSWVDPDCLYRYLTNTGVCTGDGASNTDGHPELSGPGSLSNEYGINLFRALESVGETANLIPCSATTMEGIEDIYSLVQSVYMGGEDLDQE